MLEGVEKLLPVEALAPALVAGAVWFGANYLFIAPDIVAPRLGELTYKPICVEELSSLQDRFHAEHERRRSRAMAALEAAKREALAAAEAERRKMQTMRRAVDAMVPKELRNLLGSITGNPTVVEDVTELFTVPEVPSAEEFGLPEVPPPLPPVRPGSRSAYCGCVVGAALSGEGRLPLAFHTSSMRLYSPAQIANPRQMLANTMRSEVCGPVPTS